MIHHTLPLILILTVIASPIAVNAEVSDTTVAAPHSGNIISRIKNYFAEANEPKPAKKFDISFIGGPHYASDTKFGIGLVAAGSYKRNLNDSLTPRSDVALTADVSTVGFYMLGLHGNHRAAADKIRIVYDFRFYSFPTYYWGIGYDAGRRSDDYRSKYLEFSVSSNIRALKLIAPGLYFGPALNFKWIRAKNPQKPELWNGERLTTACLGIGLSLHYDTRDNLTAPTRGVYASLDQRFYPRFMSSSYSFGSTEIDLTGYRKVWRGAIMAARLHTLLSYGNVPWSMMATFGGSYTMRGYYEGRYRDKNAADLTLELRQHIYGRWGAVVWGGAATVFPRPDAFSAKHLLPEAGVGLRWEFKQFCNVRLDYGVGRNSSGFVFSINEAF